MKTAWGHIPVSILYHKNKLLALGLEKYTKIDNKLCLISEFFTNVLHMTVEKAYWQYVWEIKFISVMEAWKNSLQNKR